MWGCTVDDFWLSKVHLSVAHIGNKSIQSALHDENLKRRTLQWHNKGKGRKLGARFPIDFLKDQV